MKTLLNGYNRFKKIRYQKYAGDIVRLLKIQGDLNFAFDQRKKRSQPSQGDFFG